MNIHEYQAKKLFENYSIPIPEGLVAATPQEATKIAAKYDFKVVVKAQVHAGGRGKGGGVKLAKNLQEVESISNDILGMMLINIKKILKCFQTR